MNKKIKIGNITLENNAVLAPMAGITDLPLRLLAKQNGAGLVYTEMVSSKGLVYADEKTKRLLKISPQERPVAAQIFGSEIKSMANAAKIVADLGADIVDINLGCPVRKIAKSGSGAKLLENEKLISEILEAVVKAVSVPVTIKTRIGLKPEENIGGEIIKIATDCGIKMVALHARYACNGHAGAPNLIAFRDACAEAKIPVIGNGGIVDQKTATDFLEIPNCAGLMIGRGAIGNYSIFNDLSAAPTTKQKMQWLSQHARASLEHYSNDKGLIVMRKTVPYYVKGLPNAAMIRDRFNKITRLEEFEKLIEELA